MQTYVHFPYRPPIRFHSIAQTRRSTSISTDFGRTRIRRTVAAAHHFDHMLQVSRDRTDSHLSDGPRRVDHITTVHPDCRNVRSHTCRRLSDHENSIRAVSRTTIAASNTTYPHIQTVIPHHLTDAGVPRRLRPLHTKHFTIFSLLHVIINPNKTIQVYRDYSIYMSVQ